jgi:hypothetical protein
MKDENGFVYNKISLKMKNMTKLISTKRMNSQQNTAQKESNVEAEPRPATEAEPQPVEQSEDEVQVQTQQVTHTVKVRVGDHVEYREETTNIVVKSSPKKDTPKKLEESSEDIEPLNLEKEVVEEVQPTAQVETQEASSIDVCMRDLQVLKSLANPPRSVMYVLDCVSICMRKNNMSWRNWQAELKNPRKFAEDLGKFANGYRMDEQTFNELRKHFRTQKKRIELEAIMKSSAAVYGLAKWV